MINNIRVRHFHDSRGRLVATIATQNDDDGMVRVAAAVCNSNDMPLKAIGRQLAAGRLVTGQFIRMTTALVRLGISNGSIVRRFANRNVVVKSRFVDTLEQDSNFQTNFRSRG